MPRELHLSVALDGTGGPTAASLTAAHWTALAALAEEGALDFVTLGDASPPPRKSDPGGLDPVAVLARVAPLTRGLGLVPLAATGPSRALAALAGLDLVSEGRAGRPVEARAEGDGPRTPREPSPAVVALRHDDPAGRWELSARQADVVLLDADRPATARSARRRLEHGAREAGRAPEDLRILLRVAVALNGGTGTLPPAGHRLTGAATALAARLDDLRAESEVDGFHLVPASPATDLPAVVHGLVPALRARGVFRAGYTGYAGRTLRDHLRLPRPAPTPAAGAAPAPAPAPAPAAAPAPAPAAASAPATAAALAPATAAAPAPATAPAPAPATAPAPAPATAPALAPATAAAPTPATAAAPAPAQVLRPTGAVR
ncbi:hypothetical protein [Streptomyces sp. NPDC005012]|uniref:hypothetical protein n=1 Tax=Streptomyces sp. NPDC005012 TaxID=3154558 RepID=UPI0033BF02AE